MFKQRLFLLIGIAFLAFSPSAWADDDIQIMDEPAPTATPAPKAVVAKPDVAPTPTMDADDLALLKEIEAEKAATGTPKAPPSLTPTPVEDEQIAAEDTVPTPPPKAPVKKVHQLKPAPTPTPAEDENADYIQEDRTLRDRDLGKKIGALEKPLMIFTLDGVYSKSFNNSKFNSAFDSGIGGDFRMEVQFYRWIAVGLYYDLVDFTGPGSLAGEVGMFGRIIPLKEGPLEFYAIGGMGLNSLVFNNPRHYPGNFQGFAGLGLHTSFSDNWGLDGNVVYAYYSPEDDSLNAVAVRAGITYSVDLQAFLASLSGSPKVKPKKIESQEPE